MQTDLSPISVDTMTAQPATAPQPGSGRSSREMDDFIYLISHDVRASVRALLELPQWIREDLEEAGVHMNGQVAETIDLMNRHTGRLDRMLVDLLSYSRVGRLQTMRQLDLDDVLDDVLDQTRLPSGFAVLREFECTQIFMGDRDLPTLLDALISNAVKHHDRPRGRILVRSQRQGGLVVISVADDGPGIEDAAQEKVFAPMTTLRPRDEVEGSGMGLAIAGKIALHYGGAAQLTPSPFGRGSCIEISIASDRRA